MMFEAPKVDNNVSLQKQLLNELKLKHHFPFGVTVMNIINENLPKQNK